MSQLHFYDKRQEFSKNTEALLATFCFPLQEQIKENLHNQVLHHMSDTLRKFYQSQ